MKLLWCCLSAALITTVNAAVDVEKTVRQVQNILQANAELPRLSRNEILQLLNDIRAEDAKSKSSTEQSQEVTTKPYSAEENEISPITKVPNIKDSKNEKDPGESTLAPPVVEFTTKEGEPTVIKNPGESTLAPTVVESTTKKGEPTVMVVLPYTPRDGSSLQELYTRPPRVEVVPVSKVTPNPMKSLTPNDNLKQSLENNAKLAKNQQLDIPAELQAFLDAHGLKGKPGQDNFLLPLEGFKPLPPAKVVDGTVQLPENILLTYDLVPSNSENNPVIHDDGYPLTPNYLYQPLRPELPFELDISSSETKKTVIPYDLPKTRKVKSADKKPNYDPIDYDSVKVIPLRKGISPLESVKSSETNEPNKRQTNETSVESSNNQTSTVAPTDTNVSKNAESGVPAVDSSAADTDSGASIADLADSFGGAAPEKPGDSELPPPRKNGFYWMLDWNSFLEVGDGDTKVNIRFEPKFGDPQMFLPVNVP